MAARAVRIAWGARTDVGRGRPQNEDVYLADPDAGLWAVADGMGGHRAGEVASAMAIETMRSAFASGGSLRDAIVRANGAVFTKAGTTYEMRGMGTTVTALVVTEGRFATIGHVGDSRGYLLRDGGLTQVTVDHSYVEQLVQEGRIDREEAAHHPQRAVILRALGIEPDIEVDVYDVDLRPGDRLVLCSDGLSDMVAEPAMAALLRRHPDPQRAADVLVDAANDAGGNDNITVVVVDAVGDPTAEGAAASSALGVDRGPGEATGEWVAVGETEPPDVGAEAEPAPVVAVPVEANPGARHARRGGRSVTARRFLVWVLPIVVVVAGAFTVVGWYARRTFYVGFAGDRVALYRGVPGGILGWDPTVEERSDLAVSELSDKQRADLDDGQRFSSRSEAVRFLDRLERTRRVERASDETPGSVTTATSGGSATSSTTVSTGTATTGPTGASGTTGPSRTSGRSDPTGVGVP